MSRRQEVINAIVGELNKITIAGGFTQDIGEVGWIFKRPDQVNKWPAAFVHTGGFDEAKERFPTRSKQAELIVLVTFYTRYDSAATDLNNLISDAEKTIEDLPTMGKSFVIDTWVAGISSMEDEPVSEGPVNRADMEIRCIYRHARATP